MSKQEIPPSELRPLVAGSLSNRRDWLVALLMVAFGAFAAWALTRNFFSPEPEPLARQETAGESMIVPPPPLAIPDAPTSVPVELAGMTGPSLQPQRFTPSVASPPPAPFVKVRRPTAAPQPSPPPYEAPPPLPRTAFGPAVVYQAQPAPVPTGPQAPGSPLRNDQRVEATRFANPATTIPQGAVVQAVLETALDSTRPGPARAIVSRDVRSFDGTRVLIPRGSRLYGDYKADISQGQSRALIQWTRLLRPDGVTIALDSPSADPLGRAGVGGKVNSHFLARFGNAFLQTTLSLGMNYAANQIGGGTVIVGLPGSFQTVTPQTETIKPTLKVAQGTPVSVFVARDLDFTQVEQ